MSEPPVICGRTVVYEGYLSIETLRLRLADGTEISREIETHGDAIAVLPYDPDRRVALTVQLLRAPVLATTGQTSLEEACAGMIDGEDTPENSAKREALEELGVQLTDLELVAQVWPSPGVSTEQLTLFLSAYRQADRVAAGGGLPSEHEDIEVKETALSSLAEMADRGHITDPKLLILVSALRLRRPSLFT